MKSWSLALLFCCSFACAQIQRGVLAEEQGQPITAGALIVWDFHEQSGKIAHNVQNGAVYATPNILNLSERGFNINGVWAKNNGGTITDNFALGPDGVNQNASRYQMGGNSFLLYAFGGATIPAGTTTFSIWAKSNTGGSQLFRLNMAGTPSADITATTSWQRLSYTAALGSPTGSAFIEAPSTVTAQDILFYGAQIETAASPSTFQKPTLDLLFGSAGGATNSPTWTGSRTITNTSAQYGLASSDTDFSLGTMTTYVAVKSTTSTPNQYGSIFEALVNSGVFPLDVQAAYYNASAQGDGSLNQWPFLSFGGLTKLFPSGNLWDQQWHVIAIVGTGSDLHFYIDGLLIDSPVTAPVAGTPATIAMSLLGAGYTTNPNNNFPAKYGYLALYSGVHTYTQIQSNTLAIESLVSKNGNSLSPGKRGQIVFEGDSITDGVNTGLAGYADLVGAHYGRTWINYAHAGDQIAGLNARATQLDALIDKGRPFNILVVNIGRNDLDHVNAPTFEAGLQAYWQARVAAGWTVIATTLLPTTDATAQALIPTVNTWILANAVSLGCAAIGDFGDDPTILANYTSTTYLYDGTHPTVLTHSIMAPYVWNAINSLGLGV